MLLRTAFAVEDLKADRTISQRRRIHQCKYLNNVVEQSHRNVKWRMWKPRATVPDPQHGESERHRGDGDGEQRQSKVGAKGNAVSQATFIASCLL